MTIDDVITYARSLDGLTADASTPFRQEYLAMIAPGETPQRAAEMATMWPCELVCMAILRHAIDHPLLRAPYPDGKAGEILVAIGREAHAIRAPGALPCPGDIVIVAAPEHAWFCLQTVASNYDGVSLFDGIDGLPVGGFRAVTRRQHEIRENHDDAGRDRVIRVVIDVGAVIVKFGRQ
jgi:hypothetical protein